MTTSSAEVAALADTFVATHAAAVKASPVAPTQSIPAEFATIWAEVKPILQLIAGFASWIPGIGVSAGAALQALIKIGDIIGQAI